VTNSGHRRLDQIVLEAGLVSSEQLTKLQMDRKKNGKRLGSMLIDQGLVTEDQLHYLIESKFKIPRINLNDYPVDADLASVIPADLALKHSAIPIANKKGKLIFAMADPLDLAAVDDLSRAAGKDIYPVIARTSSINHLLAQQYGMPGADPLHKPASVDLASGKANVSNSYQDLVEAAPVVRVVNSLIERAIAEGASDIHIEPAEITLRIRMRLDGVLHDLPSPPQQNQANIISRIKIMANLDIAERRLPQDGNIDWKGKKGSSLRISTLPTVYGEKVVIRILEKDKIVLPLEDLGFTADNFNSFLRLLLNQHGLLLVTGPTGSGKTTSLYSALNYLNRPGVNITTVEDPVEFRLPGINQVQVNTRIKRTFAGSLRSILRQDPDIIMVGEIRDLETAKITSQAAMTGHLVLSTLHTNNASGAVTRLVDMGLEDYLVSASLVGVIAQRLVRTICPECSTEYLLGQEEKQFFSRFFKKDAPSVLHRGLRCRHCNHTGYRGRTSIQEILVLNQELQELIMAGVTAELLQQKAIDLGMRTLVDDGLRCVEAGVTTVNEIVRTTFSSIADARQPGSADNLNYMAGLHREEY
jgi:type IV pilus assembly protein PilB